MQSKAKQDYALVLVRILLLQKQSMNTATLIKKAGAALRFQKFSLLSSWQQAWGHAGRPGAGKRTDSSTSDLQAAGRDSDAGPGLSF